MNFRRIAAILAVAIMTVPAAIVADVPEAEAAKDGSSMANAIIVNVELMYQETQVRVINTNMNLFEFVNAGDGYSITIIQDPITSGVEHVLTSTENGLQFNDTWPENNDKNIDLNRMNVRLIKRDDFSNIALLLTLTDYSNNSFFIKFWVKSYGIEQVMYYRYNITYTIPLPHVITFEPAVIRSDGVFSSQGTMTYDDEPCDLSKFKFYATGLYRGLTLKDGLILGGCVDSTDARWASNTSMNLQILCTDTTTGKVSLETVTVNYSFREAPETVIFTLKEDGVTKLSNNTEGRSVAVLAGTDLKLTLDEGTNATVFYQGDNGLERRFMLSSTLDQPEQTLPTDGAGKYVINMRQLDGTTDQISITVISTLVPINKIILSCTPA